MKWPVHFLILLVLLIPSSVFTSKNYRIVVLPFDKINKDRNLELETLSVGISETLSGALSNVNNFIIIDTFRVKKYLLESAEFSQAIGAGDDKNIDRLRRLTQDKLHGDYLVYGSFYKIGNQLKVDAKFLNIESGAVLKAASVHGVYPDKVFELQEDLAKKLTGALNGNVNERQTESMNQFINSTSDYLAYRNYIQARMEHLKYNVKDYPKAIELYGKSLARDPKFALAWAGLCEVNAQWAYAIKYAGGEYRPRLEQAINEGQKAVELGGNLYQTHRALSIAYVNNDDFDRARKSIESAYALNSRDPEVLYVKASVTNYDYKEMGKPGTESNKYITLSLSINPDLIIARWALAHSLQILGNNDESLAEYKKILAINQLHAPSMHNMALIYYNKKDYQNTILYAQKAAGIDLVTPQYDCTVGLGHYGLKDLANAEKFFRVSLSKNPLYAPSLYNMALVYYNKKDHQMTIQYAKKAIEADPGNSQYDNMVGLGYYGLKDWVNAERAYREALRKNPAFQDALFNLAGSLYMQARYREARDAYSGVLKLRPDYPGAEKWMKMSEDLMKGE